MALFRCTSSNNNGLSGGNITKKGNVDLIGAGLDTSINVKDIYPDLYTQFTEENFIIVPDNASISRTSTTGSFGNYRTMPTYDTYSNKLTKSYDPTTGIFSFNFILNDRSIIDCSGYTSSADANATLNVPCDIYVFHPNIKSKVLYEVGSYDNSEIINMSNINDFDTIWESDIIVSVYECNTSGSVTGETTWLSESGESTRNATATASYTLTSSYNRNTGEYNFNINLSGFGDHNNIKTKVYVIQ